MVKPDWYSGDDGPTPPQEQQAQRREQLIDLAIMLGLGSLLILGMVIFARWVVYVAYLDSLTAH